jgi:hypothetical protein
MARPSTRWMANAFRSCLSFLEVMSLHVLTYPYARGSSFGVARHFVRSLGAPRLWGECAQPLTLRVGQGGRACPLIIRVRRGRRTRSLTLGVGRGDHVLLQCFTLGCRCPFSWWAVLPPFGGPPGPNPVL